MGTKFAQVYNRFLGKITDDMYVELTPEDTMRDMQHLLISAIPEFEFPRKRLDDYEIKLITIDENLAEQDDFIIGVTWDELSDGEDLIPEVIIDRSSFSCNLTSEEINILAVLMMIGWLQRQITSIENIRMKYSGTDFKMTSQANHLSKLLSLLAECQRQSHHLQRLYKRRKTDENGQIQSNWSIFARGTGNVR